MRKTATSGYRNSLPVMLRTFLTQSSSTSPRKSTRGTSERVVCQPGSLLTLVLTLRITLQWFVDTWWQMSSNSLSSFPQTTVMIPGHDVACLQLFLHWRIIWKSDTEMIHANTIRSLKLIKLCRSKLLFEFSLKGTCMTADVSCQGTEGQTSLVIIWFYICFYCCCKVSTAMTVSAFNK